MRKVGALVGVGVAALAIRGYLGLRMRMSAAAPELRSLGLLAFGFPLNARTLPLLRLIMGCRSGPGSGVTRSEHHLDDGDVDVVVLTPDDDAAPRPAVLKMHGGGMVAGTAQFEVQPGGDLVRALGAVVVLPEYRLAPENPFPAALDDCMTALRWMVEHADDLGIDRDRIAVTGASSGGGLAAAVAQRALDEGIALVAQALIYPMLDDRTALCDDLAGRGELTWSPSSNRWAWTAYLGREPRMSDAPEYAAPARRADMTGLPAAWIGVGDLDVFYDESVAYAESLSAAGVACELVTVAGMYHTADGIVRKAPSMQRFSASMVQFLRTYLVAAE